MGRTYVADDTVQKYLSSLHTAGGVCITGLLIGQLSLQRDYVLLSTKTPHRDSDGPGEGHSSSGLLDDADLEWATEHAKQVSQMLPGGMSVLGVFLIVPPELSKEAPSTLRRLVFAIEKHISKGRLWDLTEEDITERVTLQICSKTKKALCRSFDIKDPKSSAKPADWKYQPVSSSSWPLVTCTVALDLQISLPLKSLDDICIKEGLRSWANRIKAAVCLINGKLVADESELVPGQKKNPKMGKQKFQVQVLLQTLEDMGSSAVTQCCRSFISIRGAVHCRAYLQPNKPRAKHAVEAIRKDLMNTVSCRVNMLMEDLLMNEFNDQGVMTGVQPLPHRVFVALPASDFRLCDYVFPDESIADVAERLHEMLDSRVTEESIDSSLEPTHAKTPMSSRTADPIQHSRASKQHIEAPKDIKKSNMQQYYTGLLLAAGIAFLAMAASLIFITRLQ
ncbi:protein odr-4 homolog isoform X2 [Denticeps clupeoides]|uniref:Protein odr-4 homolog n=1 Tax=Denticeps clupeoides TaxID=299321 RepID=A0AAY4CMQ6_9TELE|nr:protein odr-4 homolog isoform X2 [Denticeps clupeoides]